MLEKSLLVKFILSAMLFWIPLSEHAYVESQDVTEARYLSIASDIADVVMDPQEQGVLTAAELHGHDPATGSAILLANLAGFEGGYQAFVDDGTCNRPEYKPDGRGGCDNKQAWSLWQIHTMGGLVLTEQEFVGRFYATDLSRIINGPDLIRDRKLAARMALHIARYSIKRTHTLCLYTGEKEGSGCSDLHPLADTRKNRAINFLAKYDFPMDTAALWSIIQMY